MGTMPLYICVSQTIFIDHSKVIVDLLSKLKSTHESYTNPPLNIPTLIIYYYFLVTILPAYFPTGNDYG